MAFILKSITDIITSITDVGTPSKNSAAQWRRTAVALHLGAQACFRLKSFLFRAQLRDCKKIFDSGVLAGQMGELSNYATGINPTDFAKPSSPAK